jgi:DNA-binding transcriptional MocR family regulator
VAALHFPNMMVPRVQYARCKMSHYMTALAMKQRGLKPAAKIVLYWLADHHNETTGACFPSLKTLAQECEMGKSTLIRHLDDLEKAGLIERHERTRENGSQTSTAYKLRLAPVPDRDTPCPKMKQAPVPNRDTHNLGIYNLGIEQDISCAIDGFAEFWERYPRRIGKAAARKAYEKALKVGTHDDIMFGLSQQMPSLASREQQYIPHPSTWLTQERWNDEPDHSAPRSGTHARADRPGAGMAQAFAAVAERLSRNPQEGGSGGGGFI